MDKPLSRQTRGHRDSIQITKIRNEKRVITTETEEFKKKSQILLQSSYSTKLENLYEMYNFLDLYQVPNLNHHQRNHPNSPITPKVIEAVTYQTKFTY